MTHRVDTSIAEYPLRGYPSATIAPSALSPHAYGARKHGPYATIAPSALCHRPPLKLSRNAKHQAPGWRHLARRYILIRQVAR